MVTLYHLRRYQTHFARLLEPLRGRPRCASRARSPRWFARRRHGLRRRRPTACSARPASTTRQRKRAARPAGRGVLGVPRAGLRPRRRRARSTSRSTACSRFLELSREVHRPLHPRRPPRQRALRRVQPAHVLRPTASACAASTTCSRARSSALSSGQLRGEAAARPARDAARPARSTARTSTAICCIRCGRSTATSSAIASMRGVVETRPAVQGAGRRRRQPASWCATPPAPGASTPACATPGDVAAVLDQLDATASPRSSGRTARACSRPSRACSSTPSSPAAPGRMYGYEGIGCIYWHMVAKLLLAAQEQALDARAARRRQRRRAGRRLRPACARASCFNKDARGVRRLPDGPVLAHAAASRAPSSPA